MVYMLHGDILVSEFKLKKRYYFRANTLSKSMKFFSY